MDYEGHGSHVASIAAGRLDGVARPFNMQGVAYNASLVVSAVDFSPTLTKQQIAAAIDYASSHGTKVINNRRVRVTVYPDTIRIHCPGMDPSAVETALQELLGRIL